ncbi:MAG TPA: SDR family NAD(P)-dependent oxidoreductase, partial [Hyphomicrobiaceae bacterium]|nr:SDR family NAD(P)-dependent oxidoreductase [Hyphomicrobiaceae bacterium]
MSTAAQPDSPGIALVTGAAHRIGRAIALHLGRLGWSVAVHFNGSREAAEAVAAEVSKCGGRSIALKADLASADEVRDLLPRCVAAIGAPTCLVNNASMFEDDRIESLDARLWDALLAVNLTAPVLLAQAFQRHLPAGQH